jgi:hypothetical protein
MEGTLERTVNLDVVAAVELAVGQEEVHRLAIGQRVVLKQVRAERTPADEHIQGTFREHSVRAQVDACEPRYQLQEALKESTKVDAEYR